MYRNKTKQTQTFSKLEEHILKILWIITLYKGDKIIIAGHLEKS